MKPQFKQFSKIFKGPCFQMLPIEKRKVHTHQDDLNIHEEVYKPNCLAVLRQFDHTKLNP